MNKINLALTSDNEDQRHTTVHLNAAFESREAAIEFHAKVAALCRDATRAAQPSTFRAAWPRLVKP